MHVCIGMWDTVFFYGLAAFGGLCALLGMASFGDLGIQWTFCIFCCI